jgi:hypothetical protein
LAPRSPLNPNSFGAKQDAGLRLGFQPHPVKVESPRKHRLPTPERSVQPCRRSRLTGMWYVLEAAWDRRPCSAWRRVHSRGSVLRTGGEFQPAVHLAWNTFAGTHLLEPICWNTFARSGSEWMRCWTAGRWLAKPAMEQRRPGCRWRSGARCTGNARKRPLSGIGWGRFSGCRRLFRTVHEQRSGLAGRQCLAAMLGVFLLTQRQDREQHQPGHAHGVPEPCG